MLRDHSSIDPKEIYKIGLRFILVIIETMSLRYYVFVFKSWVSVGVALPEPVVSASCFHIHREDSTNRSVVRKS